MADPGPFMEDVPFAWDAASRLKHAFLRAASELEEQVPRRDADARHTLEDRRGAYADEVEGGHMAIATGDAREVAAECRRCAEVLEQVGQLAREEQGRREIARERKREHDAWEREHANDSLVDDVGDVLGRDDEPKPPDLPEVEPHPLVSGAPPVRERG